MGIPGLNGGLAGTFQRAIRLKPFTTVAERGDVWGLSAGYLGVLTQI